MTGQIHFTVFQYNSLQAQRAFPIDVLASLHRPRRTVCLAVRTSHLSCGWPLHHSQSSVREANLSKIRTRGSQMEPGLANTAVDWTIQSRTLELQPLPRQRCGQVQHTVTQLSASFLLDSRPKFPDQFSIVNTSNSLPSLQVVNHQHTLTIPEYRRHDFASRGNLAKLYWHASIACSAAWSRDRSGERRNFAGSALYRLRFSRQHSRHQSSTHLVVTQRVGNNMMGYTVW